MPITAITRVVHDDTQLSILRAKQIQAKASISRSAFYLLVKNELWTKPISLGRRAVGWPAKEVNALIAARIAGLADQDIRRLVKRLEAARASALDSLGGVHA